MKKKLLLLGNNKRLITDFFMQMDFYFICASTSIIAGDMATHYQFFEPDAIVYCMRAESRDNIIGVTSFVENVAKKGKTPFIVVADASDYEFLGKMPGGRADLRIGAGASISEIQSEVNNIITRYKNNQLEEVTTKNVSQLDDTFSTLAKLEAELSSVSGAASDVNIQKLAPKSESAATTGRPRILVVDDSTIIHKAIKSYVENVYDVSTAISGAAALRFLQAKEVNAILLDYEMPEMDGPEVLTQIRNNPLTANIPVIFLTGVNDTSKIQKALMLKPNGYLLKPIDKNVLMDKLKEILG
ncbi:MAG: response regulator [Lachnospiraceae bacterium]|nr:response regulator [Lachnospiraceae bacterium]